MTQQKMSKEDIVLATYRKGKNGKCTFYSKDKDNTKKMMKDLSVMLGLKQYEVIDYLLKKELKQRGIT